MKARKLEDVGKIPVGEAEKIAGSCETHGDFTVPALWLFGQLRNKTPSCPKCVEIRKQQEDTDRLQQEREKRKRALLNNSNLPSRFYGSRFSGYETKTPASIANLKTCRDYADNWPERFSQGSNMVLTGKPGTGKTHLMGALINQVIVQHMDRPLYTTASQMLRYIRSAYGDYELTEAKALSTFTSPDLLIIDEVGTKLASDHDKATLFEIIDIRYHSELPTAIVTNLTVEQVENQIDERMIDRLAHNGVFMAFDWESYRGRT